MSSEIKVGLFIFHRDLRIQDNRGLNNFCELCDIVIPIFIFTPQQIDNDKNNYKSIHSVRFMIEALSDLYDSLNGNLYTYYGKQNDILRELYKKIKYNYLGFNQDTSPFSIKRSKGIEKVIETINDENNGCIVKVKTYDDYYLCDFKNDTLLNSGHPYVKFSAFENRVAEYLTNGYNEKEHPLKVVERTQLIKKKCDVYKNSTITTHLKDYKYYISLGEAYISFVQASNDECCKGVNTHGINIDEIEFWEGNRKKAMTILEKLRKGSQNDYGKKRNDLTYSTTQLSAFIKYGLVSVREVACSMLGINCNKKIKITTSKMKNNPLFRQLIWREFYAIILFYIPRVLGEPFQEKYKKLKWTNNNTWTQAWKDGRTGYPIVDACMTQLNKSGYMHNRGRLIVSSFLVKILLTDWREGEHYFASMLVDYDPASNNGNWQWVAGTGTDSMPYFRIFNPWLQGEKHDKDASYIKKWLPHLQKVEPKHLHHWDEYYKDYDLKELGYLKPIVDYKTQRMKALKLYKSI